MSNAIWHDSNVFRAQDFGPSNKCESFKIKSYMFSIYSRHNNQKSKKNMSYKIISSAILLKSQLEEEKLTCRSICYASDVSYPSNKSREKCCYRDIV